MYSGKSGCIQAKDVVFGAKSFYSGKSGCFQENLFYSSKVDVFLGKSGCTRAKLVVFGQKLL